MNNVLFYTRNDALNHVIIKNIVNRFKEFSNVEIIKFNNIVRRRRGIRKEKYEIVYHDDPIAVFLFFIFGIKSFKVLHSLEMYEYQVELNSLKRIIRFLVFKTLHRFSIKHCDLIIFPNELRRSFYLNKYPWLKKNKTSVLENIPLILSSKNSKKYPEDKITKDFCGKFKKTLIITGAVSEGRDISNIINAFERQEKYGLCIITQSNIKNSYSGSVLIFNNLAHENVLSLYKYFDAGLLFYENSPLNVKFCAPTKMYEYLSNGLYLIGNDNYSLRNNAYVDFFFTEPSDIFEALDSISQLSPKEGISFDFYEAFDNAFKGLKSVL